MLFWSGVMAVACVGVAAYLHVFNATLGVSRIWEVLALSAGVSFWLLFEYFLHSG